MYAIRSYYEIYLDGSSGRVVHVWADAANESAAFTDVVSGGRLALGLARSGGSEWDAFGVDLV